MKEPVQARFLKNCGKDRDNPTAYKSNSKGNAIYLFSIFIKC